MMNQSFQYLFTKKCEIRYFDLCDLKMPQLTLKYISDLHKVKSFQEGDRQTHTHTEDMQTGTISLYMKIN